MQYGSMFPLCLHGVHNRRPLLIEVLVLLIARFPERYGADHLNAILVDYSRRSPSAPVGGRILSRALSVVLGVVIWAAGF